MTLRSPTELTTRMMKDAIGGLSLVRLDTSGNNLTNKTLFFSTDKCLHFKPEKDIYKNQTTLFVPISHQINSTKSKTRVLKL